MKRISLSLLLVLLCLGNAMAGGQTESGGSSTSQSGSTESAYSRALRQGEQIIYVSASGDDSNDGLSEATPVKSLTLAYGQAGEASINTIAVIGTLDGQGDLLSMVSQRLQQKVYMLFGSDDVTQQITITGKPGATGAERAVLSANGLDMTVVTVTDKANIHFEHIEISGSIGEEDSIGILITGEAQVTLGQGAVVRGNSSAGIAVVEGTCVIDGGEVRDNTGPGIAVNEKGVLTMRSGVISDNRSPGNAGGVGILNGGRFTMSGGTISGNSAAQAGAGVYVMSGGRFDQTGGTISGNTALQGSNPNVYRAQGALGSNPTPGGTSTQVVASSTSASYYVSARGNDDNDGLSESNPMKSLFSAIFMAQLTDIKKITVIGTLNDTSEASSESSACVFPLMTLVETPEILITGKPGASGNERAVLSGRGSGKAVVYANMAKIRFEQIEISGGEGGNGGGLAIMNGASVTLGPGVVVRGNSVMGIGIIDGTCIIDGGEVRDNAVRGIAVDEKGILTMRSGAIRDNRSSGNGAGVAVISGGRFTMSGGTITGNRASQTGGGVLVFSGGRFDQTGGTISGNTAQQGANVYRQSGALGSNPTPGGTSSTTPSTPSTPPSRSPPPPPKFFGFHVPVYLGLYGQGLNLNTGSFGALLQPGLELDFGRIVSLAVLGDIGGGLGWPYVFEYNYGGMAELTFANKHFGVGAGLGVKGAVIYWPDSLDMTNHIKNTYTRAALIFRGTYKFSLFAEYYHKEDPLFTYDNWNNLKNWGFGFQWAGNMRD